jgi:PAS domain-containing protein
MLVKYLLLLMHRLLAVFRRGKVTSLGDQGAVFLLDKAGLVDATPAAQAMIAGFGHLPDRDAILAVLAPQFPDLAACLAQDDRVGREFAHLDNPHMRLLLDWPGGRLRLSLQGDPLAAEMAVLRDMAQMGPHLAWRSDKAGRVTWANGRYRDHWIAKFGTDLSGLADQRLFAVHGDGPCRLPLSQDWFDITTIRQDSGALHFATDANALVRADQDRQDFIQTLGKTFAELAIGLAIFDKGRRLVTFNPALLDMTRLSFDFLGARPSLDDLLDRLRENRILPEPKDYASWRDRFTAVETAARNGTYREVWTLPDGQAFRVTGRPHPDGAFAFVFEDITADLSLTRRFRSDLETGQAVLDALPDAVAVFTTAGTLVMFNRAYSILWATGGDQGLEHRAITGEAESWQNRCTGAPDWAGLQQFIHHIGPRQPWAEEVVLTDGRLIHCHASPIAGGMTMVRFIPAPRGLPILQKLMQPDPTIRVVKGLGGAG